jgi:hypothetical protein
MGRVIVGVDPHKKSVAIEAVDDQGRVLDDGINITAPDTVLANNHADRNADLGIQAVPGTADRGGNTAHTNGNPLQCVEVACNSCGSK